jgi:hypothetical protein
MDTQTTQNSTDTMELIQTDLVVERNEKFTDMNVKSGDETLEEKLKRDAIFESLTNDSHIFMLALSQKKSPTRVRYELEKELHNLPVYKIQ